VLRTPTLVHLDHGTTPVQSVWTIQYIPVLHLLLLIKKKNFKKCGRRKKKIKMN
jgi:hypothetical protein